MKVVIIKRIWSKIEKLIKIIEVFKKDRKRNCLIRLIYILKGFNTADNFRPEANSQCVNNENSNTLCQRHQHIS